MKMQIKRMKMQIKMKSRLTALGLFAALMVSVAVLPAAAQSEYHGSFERTLKVSGPVDLEAVTGSGSMDIRGGDGDSVYIKAKISASRGWFSMDGDIAERIKAIEKNPPVEQHGETIRVGHFSDDDHDLRNISISYEITLPKRARVTSKTGSGSQTIRDVAGPVRVSSGSGSITVSKVNAEVRANAGSGSINLDSVKGYAYTETGSGSINATDIAGGFSSHSGSGSVHFEQTAPGSVKIEAGSGSIRAKGVHGSLEARTGSGTIEAEGAPAGEWHVHTGSGTTRLLLPQSANFDLQARSGSGQIKVDHPLTVQGSFNRHETIGKVGSGGVLVEVSTGSGSINIE